MLPAHARLDGDRHIFALAADTAPALDQREVVLVIDDGPYWFQHLAWYTVDTRRVLAWDYGAVREE